MMGRLEGKRIFLTGAAQGIGYAIAEACLREKAELFLVDRDAELLAESAGRLGKVAHVAA
ncbi:MAG: SDR family NAD(P)-dependent oxidoreductase, partial [Mesorhizobium sp.]